MKAPHTEPDREGDIIECLRAALHLSAVFWLLIAAVVLAGCAQRPLIWDKDGATQQDFNQDKYSCARDAIAAGGLAYIGFGMTQRVPDERMFYACMVAHGWTARRQ